VEAEAAEGARAAAEAAVVAEVEVVVAEAAEEAEEAVAEEAEEAVAEEARTKAANPASHCCPPTLAAVHRPRPDSWCRSGRGPQADSDTRRRRSRRPGVTKRRRTRSC